MMRMLIGFVGKLRDNGLLKVSLEKKALLVTNKNMIFCIAMTVVNLKKCGERILGLEANKYSSNLQRIGWTYSMLSKFKKQSLTHTYNYNVQLKLDIIF